MGAESFGTICLICLILAVLSTRSLEDEEAVLLSCRVLESDSSRGRVAGFQIHFDDYTFDLALSISINQEKSKLRTYI